MRSNEGIRVAVLVILLTGIGVVGEVAGNPVAEPAAAAPVQMATIGVGNDTGGAMTTALWTMQLFGILMFEIWAFSRRRWSKDTVQQDQAGAFSLSSTTNHQPPAAS